MFNFGTAVCRSGGFRNGGVSQWRGVGIEGCPHTNFTSSGKTSTAEPATTMGKGIYNKCWLEQLELSWLNNESEAKCTLRGPST